MADGSGLKIGGVEIEILAGTGKFNKELVQAEQRARKAGGVMAREFDVADRAAARLDSTLKRTASSLALLGGTFTAGAILKGIVDAADAMQLLRGRISNVLSENERLNTVWNDLFNTAQRNRQAIEATAQLYLRLRTAIKDLNHESALSITSTFGQTLAISGASAAEAASATLQFAQAMSKGRLDGDELRSVLEANSRFAILLADSLGVAVGQLRDLGEAGALTSNIVGKALASQSATIEAEFASVPLTVGQAFQQLQNGMLKYIGETDSALGASRRVAQGISLLTNNIDELGDALVVLAAAGLGGAATAGVIALGRRTSVFADQIAIAMERIATAKTYTNRWERSLEKSSGRLRDITRQLIDARREFAAAQVAAIEAPQRGGNGVIVTRAIDVELERQRQRIESLSALQTQLETRAVRGASSIGGAFKRAGADAVRAGAQMVSFFGGPVGLAIAAASIAMALFTHNALEAARATANLDSDLSSLQGAITTQRQLTEDLKFANERLTQAIEDQAPAAEETARRDIAALDKRLAKNKELQRALAASIKSGLDAARANDQAKKLEERDALTALAAGQALRGSGVSAADQKAASNYLDRSGDFVGAAGNLLAGRGFRSRADIDPGVADRLIEAARKQAEKDLEDGKQLTATQRQLLEIFRDAEKRTLDIEDRKQQLTDILQGADERPDPVSADPIEQALAKYRQSVAALRKAVEEGGLDFRNTTSAGVAGSLEELAKTDVATARRELESVKDLLSPRDMASVQEAFKRYFKLTVTPASNLREFRDAAGEFAAALKTIRDADPSGGGNKSLATLQAILDYGREIKDLPAAFDAIDSQAASGLLKPEDAARARAELANLARENAANFGPAATLALERYKAAMKKIAEGEAASIKANENDPARWAGARAEAMREYAEAIETVTTELDDMTSLMRDTLTPAEQLLIALEELNGLQAVHMDGASGDRAIARARINLLEDEAAAAGEAYGALKKLNDLQAAAGYTSREIREVRDRIRSAAEDGRRGRRGGELSDTAVREQAANLFAQTFTEAIVNGIRTGNFGEALREVVAQKTAEGLTDAVTEIGRFIGDWLFAKDGGLENLVSGLARGGQSGSDAAGAIGALGTAVGNAAAQSEQFGSVLNGVVTAGALSSANADAAAAGAATTTALALTAVATAAGAAATALAAIAAEQGVNTVASMWTMGLTQAAGGGKGSAGMPMIVGEAGPEVFIPGADGYVVGNAAIRGAGRGSMGAANTPLAIDARTIVQGDVGTADTLRAMQEANAQQQRDLPRIIRGTLAQIESRR